MRRKIVFETDEHLHMELPLRNISCITQIDEQTTRIEYDSPEGGKQTCIAQKSFEEIQQELRRVRREGPAG